MTALELLDKKYPKITGDKNFTIQQMNDFAEEYFEEQLKDGLYELIYHLTDGGDCYYDHHGYCQEHGWTDENIPCPHKLAKSFLSKYEYLFNGSRR